MKNFLFCFMLTFAALYSAAQSTTASSTGVVDSDGFTWANGIVTVSFVPSPFNPSFSAYSWTGGVLTPAFATALSGTGTFSISLPSNTAISPAGSQWRFQLCPNATSGCFSFTTTLTGTTQNLTTSINAVAKGPRFPGSTSTPLSGYGPIEINTAVATGTIFFNTTTNSCQQFNGISFQSCGTGGGGSGTVTQVSVTSANGISGSVATPSTTPAISLTLGAITPTTVNGVALTTGDAATVFLNGTGNYSTPASSGGLPSGCSSPGTGEITCTGTITASTFSGNATSATTATTATTANNITATSNSTLTSLPDLALPASQLTGTTLPSSIVASSLTSAAGGTLGTAAFQSTSAFDASGAAATAQSNAEAFTTASFAPLASPALTGTPTAPTQSAGDNTTAIATDAFVLANASGLPAGCSSSGTGILTCTGLGTFGGLSNQGAFVQNSTSTTPFMIFNSAMATNGFNAIQLGKSTSTNASASIVFNNNATPANATLALGIAGGGTISIGSTGSLTSPTTRRGTFTCTAAGTITVASTPVIVGSDILITLETASGTITTTPAIKTLTAGTGFSVLCGATDTSVYRFTVLN
jgi:hypothetical protein